MHDVGGEQGYGAPETNIPAGVQGSAFAARWEAAVFAMVRVMGAVGVLKNSDQFRHAIERVDPQAYFSHGYYGRWLGGVETLLREAGELERADLDARVGELAQSLGATRQQIDELASESNIASRANTGADIERVAPSLNAGSSVRYIAQPPRFCIGERVVAAGLERSLDGAGQLLPQHTRLPAYARGCVGTVVAWHRGWVLPDTNAHSGEENPAHLYGVAFPAQELYGATAEAGVTVHLDLFEPYLQPVEA